MPRRKGGLDVKVKGFELSTDLCERLENEPFGHQSIIAENAIRDYYGLEPVLHDRIQTHD